MEEGKVEMLSEADPDAAGASTPRWAYDSPSCSVMQLPHQSLG